MKKCELCKSSATVYCESDQAILCWTCDAKVHSANFLVARHSRNLLCHVCQSPTPWSASGERLAPSTVSVCEKCVVDGVSEDDDDDDGEESYGANDEEDEYDGEDELDLEDEDDNQVVPLSSMPPPPAASSSSSDEFPICFSVKRKRHNVADLSSEDDFDCTSVRRNRHSPPAEAPPALPDSPPSSSEIRNGNMISGENKLGAVVGMDKATKTVGLDVNPSDSP